MFNGDSTQQKVLFIGLSRVHLSAENMYEITCTRRMETLANAHTTTYCLWNKIHNAIARIYLAPHFGSQIFFFSLYGGSEKTKDEEREEKKLFRFRV